MAAEAREIAEVAALRVRARQLAAAPERLLRDYTPYGAAKELFESTEREVCLVGPSSTGKSRACLELLHRNAVQYPHSRQLIVRETRDSLTQSTLVTLEKRVFPDGVFGPVTLDRPIQFHGEKRQYQYPNGSIIAIAGLDTPGRIYSSDWDTIYVGEAWETSLDAYEQLLRGLRNQVIPKQQLISDMNPTHELHWLHQRCDAGITRELVSRHSDNPTLTPDVLRTLESMTGARRDRLFLGRRVVDIEGSYYGKYLYEAKEQGRMPAHLPIDPVRPVYTSWDLGVADFTTIWFWQVAGKEYWVIDYYEMSGEGLAHYAQVLQRKGYTYAVHYLPHDITARVQALRADTKLGILRQLLPGQRLYVTKRVTDVSHRIEAVRAILPMCYFDGSVAPPEHPEQRNTAKGIQRLIAYKRDYNEQLGVYATTPRHDEASHAADSFGTFALGYTPVTSRPKPEFQRFR